jgi:hypothetical protein
VWLTLSLFCHVTVVPGATWVTSGLKQLLACEQFGLAPAPAEMFTFVPESAKADGAIARIATRVKTPNTAPIGFDIISPYRHNQLINSMN